MIIRETKTVERECCQDNDLVLMPDAPSSYGYSFCIYCGRHHMKMSFTDEAGDVDWKYVRLPMPWED
jgi:hypothetical protein